MNLMKAAYHPIRYANDVAIDYNSPFDGIVVSSIVWFDSIQLEKEFSSINASENGRRCLGAFSAEGAKQAVLHSSQWSIRHDLESALVFRA